MVAQDGGGDDDVLRRQCGHLAIIPFGGGCGAPICRSEEFTLWDFCWKSTVHELCTNASFSAYWG